MGIAVAVLAMEGPARADEIVQLPAGALLDGRPVSTLTGGVVVPWTVGIDKDDAYMTLAAATSLRQTGPALPDDGKFAATADHPEVVLHFSNAAPATSPQAHVQTAVGSFAVTVPSATYRKVFLFLTSSYGDAPLSIKLTYADKTTAMVTFTLPDWGTGAALPTNPPIFFNLIAGLHKWNKAGMSLDTPSHTITGVTLTPAADRALTTIELTKTTAAPWLTFWGATGIATSPPGDGGAEDANDAAPIVVGADAAAETNVADAAGTGGATGAAGTGGATPAGVGGSPGTGGAGAAGTSGAGGGAGAGVPPSPTRSSGGCSLAALGSSGPLCLVFFAFAACSSWWRRRRSAR
jgi:hypothetical protein